MHANTMYTSCKKNMCVILFANNSPCDALKLGPSLPVEANAIGKANEVT